MSKETGSLTYQVSVYCLNCNFGKYSKDTKIEIKRGVGVDEFPCPECGCDSLRLAE